MKTASPPLQELLQSKRQFICADLFTITQLSTNVLHLTTADRVVTSQGITYNPYGVQISGLRYRITAGMDADEQTVVIAAQRTHLLDGLPFLDAVRNGSLDGAKIRRARAYMEVWGDVVGEVTLFTGYVSSIRAITRLQAEISVKSNMALLDLQMPRRQWQSACVHTLYDANCGLTKSSFTHDGVVDAVSTPSVVYWASATSGNFWQGTILFTSGANAGQRRTIKNSTGLSFVLSYPLPHAPQVGDTFAASWGCDKTLQTCQNRFGNTSRNTSMPFIPSSELGL